MNNSHIVCEVAALQHVHPVLAGIAAHRALDDQAKRDPLLLAAAIPIDLT